jgi:hypothetical protein
LNSSNQRIAAFKSFCSCNGVRPRKFGLDMDFRWNSTYLILKHVVPYRSVFYTSSKLIILFVMACPCSLITTGTLLRKYCNFLNYFMTQQFLYLVFIILHLL